MQLALSPRDLDRIADCGTRRAEEFCDYLNLAMKQYGISGLRPQAHFLAQILHESGRLRYREEIWGPTPAQDGYDERTDLGNTSERDGDGYLYRGRGLIQVTGRANYEALSRHLERFYGDFAGNVLENPDLVAEPLLACLSAGWYWRSRSLTDTVRSLTADSEALRAVTRAINGGYNGLRDREMLLFRALDVLRGLHITATLDSIEVLAPERIDVDFHYPYDPRSA